MPNKLLLLFFAITLFSVSILGCGDDEDKKNTADTVNDVRNRVDGTLSEDVTVSNDGMGGEGVADAEGCRGLDFLGRCNGTIAEWCEDDEFQFFDCADDGETCEWIDDETGYWCQNVVCENCAETNCAEQDSALEASSESDSLLECYNGCDYDSVECFDLCDSDYPEAAGLLIELWDCMDEHCGEECGLGE